MAASPLQKLIRKLESITQLTPDEKQAVLSLPATIKELHPDQDVVREGDRPWQCCLVLEGFLCRYKQLPDGTRQIHSFHVPGDIPDLQSLHLSVMDHNLAAISASKVAFIPHGPLRDLTHAYPLLADKLWREHSGRCWIFREWIVNVESREAASRIAHVICETFLKPESSRAHERQQFRFSNHAKRAWRRDGTVNRSCQPKRSEAPV